MLLILKSEKVHGLILATKELYLRSEIPINAKDSFECVAKTESNIPATKLATLKFGNLASAKEDPRITELKC